MEKTKPAEQLSKKERQALQRQEKEAKRALAVKGRRVKRFISWTVVIAVITLFAGGLTGYMVTRPPIPEGEIISSDGLHWHTDIAIYVKDEKQEIPSNIGIGSTHQPIHTHDDADVIHLEFQGQVRKTDITLGQFFRNWNKDMRSFGKNMKMTVNGEINTDYEDYIMRDKDKIELRFD